MYPELKGRIEFDLRRNGKMTVDTGTKKVSFERENNGWRICGGCRISSERIAPIIFDYEPNPSQEAILFMWGFVDDIGGMLDAAKYAMREQMREEINVRTDCAEERLQPLISNHQLPELKPEYVYLMRHVNGLTKIGFSKNPLVREKTLQAEDPRLEIIFTSESTIATERRLHQIFGDLRRRGEWFDLKPHHVDWIMFILRSA